MFWRELKEAEERHRSQAGYAARLQPGALAISGKQAEPAAPEMAPETAAAAAEAPAALLGKAEMGEMAARHQQLALK